jgi:dTDP-glucose 4,6-dehydratase
LTSKFGQEWGQAVGGLIVRVLVTGGAGFIGSNFVRRTVDGTLSGISEITVLDKLTYAGTLTNLSSLPNGSYRFVQGDICDTELVNSIAKEHDVIVNFAAESHVDRSITGAKDFIETNVLGTQNLLDAALRNEVETFVQISTDEVYGSISEGSWSEDFPLLPNSPYSASKASADLIARSYNRTFDLDVRTTRCSNNYGPHQFPEKVIPLFVTNLIDGNKVPLYGKGLNVRDWLHVDDHCRGIHAVLMKGKAGEIYNIGGGEELTNKELTSMILTKMGKNDSSIEYVQDRFGHDLRYSVSIERISRELGYQPLVKFDEGIEETIEWYKKNEHWWRPLKTR